MSEESPENYNSGDIVWVKLGTSWWPGEVKDLQELPSEEFDFKKPPLAIVKFFDEDSYEYVKNWANIYPYSCEKKNDFIKKGMVGFRAKVGHMEKFPKDVIKAEAKIGGNQNILSDPMFLPEKRRNFADLFGTPSPKKANKDKKPRSNTKTIHPKDVAHITHRRFLGVDDYRAYICIQYPGKDRIPGDREDEEVLRINREPEQEFNCHTCSFTTKRLEVMILHTKSHIQGDYVSSSRRNKMPMVRKRKDKTKKSRGSDVIESESSSSDSESGREKKRKPKSQGARKSKVKKAEEAPKETKEAADARIRKELLAVWDDTDEEEEEISFNKTTESEKTVNETKLDTAEETLNADHGENKTETVKESNVPEEISRSKETSDVEVVDKSMEESEKHIEVELELPLKSINKDIHEAIQSCFDFDEEDEQAKAVTPTGGDDLGATVSCKDDSKSAEDDKDEKSTKSNKDIQEEIKSCFDFDEDEEEDHAIVSRAAAGRKIPRVIPLAERKKSVEEIDHDAILKESESFNRKGNDEADATFKELMEMTKVPDLPEVQNTLKCEQNFHNIKTIKFPDKLDPIQSPPKATKVDKKEPSEVATKLTNPKKRFVKSFEDFELMQNEIRRKEEEQMELPRKVNYAYDPDDAAENPLELTKLKSTIMSKIIEEAKIDQESKSKILLKMQKPKQDEPITETKTSVSVGSHRTPRSKILESYMNDTKKQQKELERKPEEVIVQQVEEPKIDVVTNEEDIEESRTKKEIVPPKKNKWSRRGSHPKKDKNLFLLQDVALQESSDLQSNEKVKEPEKRDNQVVLDASNTPNNVPINSQAVLDTLNNLSNDAVEEFKPVPADLRSFIEEKTEEKIPELVIEEVTEKSLTDSDQNGAILSVQADSAVVETPNETQSNDLARGEAEVENLLTNDSNKLVSEEEDMPRMEVEESKSMAEEGETKTAPQEEESRSMPQEEVETETVPQEEVVTGSALQEEEEIKSVSQEFVIGSALQEEEEIKSVPQEVEVTKSTPQGDVTNSTPQEEDVTESTRQEEDVTKSAPQEDVIKSAPQEEEHESKSIPQEEDESTRILQEAEVTTKSVPQEEVESKSTTQEEETRSMPQEDDKTESTVPAEDLKVTPTEVQHIDEKFADDQIVDDLPFGAEKVEFSSNEMTPAEVQHIDEKLADDRVVENLQSGTEKLEEFLSNDDKVDTLMTEVVVTDTVVVAEVKESVGQEEKENEVLPKKDDAKLLLDFSSEERQPEPVNEELVVAGDKDAPLAITAEDNNTSPPEVDLKAGDAALESTKPLEETAQLAPGREVFSSTSDTAVSIPMDRLDFSPKKSKKRKMSDGNFIPTLTTQDTSKDLSQDDDFVPLEKKKKAETKLNDLETKNIDAEEQDLKIAEQITNSTDESNKFDEDDINMQEILSSVKQQITEVTEHNNEVEIECASSSVESFKFSIQTNLSNLTSREEISALALATLSEIKMDVNSMLEDKAPPKNSIIVPTMPTEPELVPIEGNLTVVSEKDLADGQVEITSDQVISPKRPVTLSNFSMDFSDSASDSNSASETLSETSSKGTEFPQKAMTKQLKKIDNKKENAYERFELLNILEGNSDGERKPKEYTQPAKKGAMVDEICDFEEHIPSQIVCAANLKHDGTRMDIKKKIHDTSTASKLLERLTDSKSKVTTRLSMQKGDKAVSKTQTTPKNTKYVVKSAKAIPSTSKPIILSEQIVKPPSETPKSKKTLDDIEDVEAFVIHKDPRKRNYDDEEGAKLKSAKSAGKAKILQQTIITPAGEIIQPTVDQVQTDDNIFDINSMPIVLSDEILTPESIENMPIVISSEAQIEKAVRKPTPARIITKTTVAISQSTPTKTPTLPKHSKTPRILQTFTNKVIKNSPLPANTNATRPGKYIIVPQGGVPTAKYVSKKAPIVKRSPAPAGVVAKIPSIAPEPSGNKIMIVTNQQGQQQRLLLTPAQQKMLGYQNQRVTKTVVKGNVLQKSVLTTKTVPLIEACTSGIISKSPNILGQKVVIGTTTNTALITTSHQVISNQSRSIKTITKRVPSSSQKVYSTTSKPQKTILIKNQHGQTVRKIQGTDDELLDKQVAEQLEAIKASSGMKFGSQSKQMPKTVRRYSKKVDNKPKMGPPPLTGLHQSPKTETVTSTPVKKTDSTDVKSTPPPPVTDEAKVQQDRPLNQLVIQDAVGNQTTITEGQILALPSETVDGQPQSYMLVTLDESGNLTPLNSEALMSLDPNLGLGGDLSNMVLQIDQSALTDRPQPTLVKVSESAEAAKVPELEETMNVSVPEAAITETVVDQKVVPATEPPQTVTPSTNGDPGQQLIVTGDPIATQKFLESLTEGTTDLANILANADGNSILIQADGQQILINTNSDNQMMLSMNNDNVNVSESTEGGGNPIFATQPSKNQDILAAALADTDVFQQEQQHVTQSKITSQLSPNNALYPINVGNVLETSLTLSSPIMTPLEVPSTNSKKIPDDEADILTQVPKNVDLPITITDPNISQTVANQQVASMIANELQTNLELGLPISESTISAVSTGMNSPSYVYSLPTLDDSVDITQKPFNSSMPLLNEDVEESNTETKAEEPKETSESSEKSQDSSQPSELSTGGCFLEEEEGRFTLGGEMCSSLSEPPPEMFDLPETNQNYIDKNNVNIPPSPQSTPDMNDNASKDEDTTDLSIHADSSSEGSCEIPVQPQIVAKSLDLSKSLDSLKRSLDEEPGPEEETSKKCKFD